MAVRLRAADLAAFLGRTLEGDGRIWIEGAAALESAGPGDLAFVRSARYARLLADTRAGAVIAPPGLDAGSRPVIRSPDPARDFARALRRLHPESAPAPGTHESASVAADAAVDPSASIGPGVRIGPRSRVGPRSVLHANSVLYEDVTIGSDCTLHAGCVLREGTSLGDRVVLQPCVVLGGDGFGYVMAGDGSPEKVRQIGRVVIEDDVEIGAHTAVDRGTLGETRVGRGAKIDNLVQVAHNCRIGEGVILVAQAGLAGSTAVGRGAIVMAQAGAAGHLTIGERAFVGPQAGVHKDVPPGTRVLGSPQRSERTYHRLMAALTRLPELLRRVRALERRLEGD